MDNLLVGNSDQSSPRQIGFVPSPEVWHWYRALPMKRRRDALNKAILAGIEQLEDENDNIRSMIEFADAITERMNELDRNFLVLQALLLKLYRDKDRELSPVEVQLDALLEELGMNCEQ